MLKVIAQAISSWVADMVPCICGSKVEAISRVCASSGLILAVQELGALPLLLAGTEDQKQRWFPDLASGKQLIAFALTEAEAGSDAAAARTRAVRDGDEYVIDGAKRFISQGDIADLVAVFAVTDPDAERHRNLSCFIVEKGSAGFSSPRVEHKMGIRGEPGRRGGRGLPDRDADPRPVAAGDSGTGGRHRPGRARGGRQVRR
jgi:hypothetical protein